jgi:AcrR family transcriptional regulator
LLRKLDSGIAFGYQPPTRWDCAASNRIRLAKEPMDNATRSERTRKAALQAALTILARDGPARLTLDAIARESGMSKGGLTHQFPTKEAVLKALLEHQFEYFGDLTLRHLAEIGTSTSQPQLAAQIATLREAINQPRSVALAILGALTQDPGLLSETREGSGKAVDAIKTEAADPQLALLRWAAAQGLVLMSLFGLNPLTDQEREQLFNRLLDDGRWSALAESRKPRATEPAHTRKTKS